MKKINYIDSIRHPIITEKATILSEQNKTVFKVHKKANKKNINRSARNIKNLKLIRDEGAIIYDLFRYKNVIITSSSAKKIEERLLNEKN